MNWSSVHLIFTEFECYWYQMFHWLFIMWQSNSWFIQTTNQNKSYRQNLWKRDFIIIFSSVGWVENILSVLCLRKLSFHHSWASFSGTCSYLSDMTGGTSQFAQESLGTWTTDMLFCNICERIYMSARFSILRFLGPLLLPSTSCSGYPPLRFKTNDRMCESATVQQLISFKNNLLLIWNRHRR